MLGNFQGLLTVLLIIKLSDGGMSDLASVLSVTESGHAPSDRDRDHIFPLRRFRYAKPYYHSTLSFRRALYRNDLASP